MIRFIRRIRLAIWRHGFSRFYCWRLNRRSGMTIGPAVKWFGTPEISNAGEITISGDCVLVSYRFGNPLWLYRPCIIRTYGKGTIDIGNNFSASGCCIIAKESVKIGQNVMLGAHVTILDNDMHDVRAAGNWGGIAESRSKPVVIGDNVFIGANATILKGVTIPPGSVVGAGTVIRRSSDL